MDEEKKDNLEEKVEKEENVSENATETKVEESTKESKVEETVKETEEVVAEENKEKVEESEEKKEETSDEEKSEEKVDATEENKTEEKSESEEFVPEQLEDEDFEKEREQAKAEKKAKKLAKKEQKENGITDEENGQVKNKKSSPVKMIVIIVLILASIGVIAAYFVINLNKPENVINDFVIYFNKSEWKSVDETIDWQGFLTLALIDDNAQEEAETDADETEAVLANYMDYDAKYKTVYDELEEKGYGEIVDLIKAGQGDIETILEAMLSGAQLKVEKVLSAEKIEKTESLYKIKTDISVTSGEDKETNTVEIYVAKKDGKYKIVGGYLPTLVYQSFIYYQYISANY